MRAMEWFVGALYWDAWNAVAVPAIFWGAAMLALVLRKFTQSS
jgi:hypothetical protein